MASHVGRRRRAARAAIILALLALLALLAGCGSGKGRSSPTGATAQAKGCAATVADVLSRVVRRVYREGVHSERTEVAQRAIATSLPLRRAVESADPAAARAAAEALVAAGHMTNLRIVRAGRTLADVGGPAVTPLTGTLTDATGAPIATYTTSVWSDAGFLAESDSIAGGRVSLRVHGHTVGGSFRLPAGRLPAAGSIVVGGVPYRYASFGAKVYPAGAARVYILRPLSSINQLCGASDEDTTVNVLSHIATLIYDAEGGARTAPQVRRVQSDQPLLVAVARRDPVAATAAVNTLLNQHIVRLRVYAGGTPLTDVGGPFVLAPVSAPLRVGGHAIGSIVLSIQDDEGYLRLTQRLVGLRVLMYMNSQLVKNSLGPEPGAVPESGRYVYRGSTYRVFTLHARAFPSGPLTVRVLIPIPYA